MKSIPFSAEGHTADPGAEVPTGGMLMGVFLFKVYVIINLNRFTLFQHFFLCFFTYTYFF